MMLVSLIVAVVLFDPPATVTESPIDPSAFDRLVIDSLRDVHNRGASLYNEAKDFNGCFRLYEGSLRTVRPLLAHRPKVQKLIDDTMAKLGDDETVRAKAFRLHELIETVRGELRDGAANLKPKPAEKPPVKPTKPAEQVPEKPTEQAQAKPKPSVPEKEPIKSPMPVPLTNVPAKTDAVPSWAGIFTLAGKPLKDVDVSLVTLDLAEPKVVSGKTDANGRAEVLLPSFGRYAIYVTGTGVPEKYKTSTTSGLRIEFKVTSEVGTFNLNEK